MSMWFGGRRYGHSSEVRSCRALLGEMACTAKLSRRLFLVPAHFSWSVTTLRLHLPPSVQNGMGDTIHSA